LRVVAEMYVGALCFRDDTVTSIRSPGLKMPDAIALRSQPFASMMLGPWPILPE
jgi:hypothetical protein